MKHFGIAAVMLLVLCTLALTGRARIADKEDVQGLPTISPIDHQAIRASVVDDDPSHYTIDVRKFSNIGVKEDAPTFAVYITNNLPKKCGDFRALELPYNKPEKYKRTFNLQDHPDVLRAITAYGCVVMRNIPPAHG